MTGFMLNVSETVEKSAGNTDTGSKKTSKRSDGKTPEKRSAAARKGGTNKKTKCC